MTESRQSNICRGCGQPCGSMDGEAYEMRIAPAGTGWRVTVMSLPNRNGVATTIENSEYAAATIGIDLFHRWQASR